MLRAASLLLPAPSVCQSAQAGSCAFRSSTANSGSSRKSVAPTAAFSTPDMVAAGDSASADEADKLIAYSTPSIGLTKG